MKLFRETSSGVFIAHNATAVGELEIGRDASIWFNAVVRGDVAKITIGQRTNIQDGAIVHCDSGLPNVIEDDVTIGHAAVVHGIRVGAGSLVGMSATLLGRTDIGRQCLIAAGCVVPPGLVVPDRSVVMGVPGRIVRSINDADLNYMSWLSGHYVSLAAKYASGEVAEYR